MPLSNSLRRRLRLLFCASFIMLPHAVHRCLHLHLHLFSRLCRHTSASHHIPRVQLVVTFPGASASPSRHPGALASAIHHTSTFCSAPLAWLVVLLCLAPPPPLVVTPPIAASRRTPLVRLVCRIVRHLGLSYEWLLSCLSSHRCLLCVYAS